MDKLEFHFSTLGKNELNGSLEICAQVAEIVRSKLNMLDECFP